jgi:acetyl esterase
VSPDTGSAHSEGAFPSGAPTELPDDLAAESRQILERLEEMGILDYSSGSIEEVREQCARELPLMGEPLPVARVEEVVIDGPNGPVPLRVYHPDVAAPDRVLLWVHGGGWVLGDLELAEADCRRLCRANGAVVVAVDYRLAPEHPYPAGLEDAFAALRWVDDELRGEAPLAPHLIVGGDSSGGNLAAALCLLARDRGGPAIDHQLLIYPATDWSFDTGSYREFAKGYLLAADDMKSFWEMYAGGSGVAADPLLSVLRAGGTAELPAATFVVAGCDVLRDDTEAYVDKLRRAGVAVGVLRYPGQIHGFWSYGGITDLPNLVNADISATIEQVLPRAAPAA